MKMINKIYLLCIVILFVFVMYAFYHGYVENYNILSDRHYIDDMYNESQEDVSKHYIFISNANTLEDAVNEIGLAPIKTYEYGVDTYIFVSENLNDPKARIVLFKYNNDNHELYKVVDMQWTVISEDVKYDKDGWWFDYGFIRGIMIDSGDSGFFIPGNGQNNDVYYGIWFGDEIKNIKFKKGIFDYSLLGNDGSNNNIYFWTYELNNSREVFSQIVKKDTKEPNVGRNVQYAKDVKKLLGIKSKYEIDLRIGLYILITLLLLAITVFVYIVTFKVNGKESAIVKKVLLWLITFVLSAIVAFLIINFAYNPRLVYGECKGIGEIFYNITGHCFPNPAQCM